MRFLHSLKSLIKIALLIMVAMLGIYYFKVISFYIVWYSIKIVGIIIAIGLIYLLSKYIGFKNHQG